MHNILYSKIYNKNIALINIKMIINNEIILITFIFLKLLFKIFAIINPIELLTKLNV